MRYEIDEIDDAIKVLSKHINKKSRYNCLWQWIKNKNIDLKTFILLIEKMKELEML